jgi:sugar phosphate permease
MMIGFFCLNFVIYFFITWFPTYLIQARGFSLKELGTLGLLPGLVAIPAGWLGGYTSDALYRRGWSLTAARKTCLVGGMLMSSVITLSVFAPNAYVALGLFALAYGSLAFTAASIWSLPADVAPSPAHVASIGGIQNFAANIAGIKTVFEKFLSFGSAPTDAIMVDNDEWLSKLGYIEKTNASDDQGWEYFAFSATEDGTDAFLKHEDRIIELS